MNYLNDKPYSVVEIRQEYEKLTNKKPHIKGTQFDPTFEYSKWLELQLSDKCVQVHILKNKT